MRKFFNRKRPSIEPDPASPALSSASAPPLRPPASSISQKPLSVPPPDRPGLGLRLPHRPSHSSDGSSIAPSIPDLERRPSNDLPALNISRDLRDKRQVAFVSPDITCLTNRPPTPSAPQPSHPSLRPASASAAIVASSRAMNYTNPSSFHHPPASVMSPHRHPTGPWRSDGSAGSQSGSLLGHQPSHTSPEPSRDHSGDRIPPTLSNAHRPTSPLSFLSSSCHGRRSSGGVIGPADTWGGNVIGCRLGEDIYQPMTWSEMTDLDLVENLSGRERTRQEVLWEIVASEERYVSELVSLRNNYITPLLYPMISPILLSPPSSTGQSQVFSSPNPSNTPISSSPTILTPPINPSDLLPIAARFVRSPSPVSNASHSNHSPDNIPDMDSEDCHRCPTPSGQSLSSPDVSKPISNRISLNRFGIRTKKGSLTDSCPPVRPPIGCPSNRNQSSSSINNGKSPINTVNPNSTLRGIRHYLRPPNPPNKLQKQAQANNQSALQNHANFEYLLPDSLKMVFNVVNEGMFRGHEDLSVQLKEKYLEQFPLVRDLTSVWAEQTWIIETYSVYVMHLERALREVEEALSTVGRKNTATKDQKRLASIIMQLEENAAGQGECGLSICLLKPFQRLLKYPLLFQNLLYHTDGSTHEYESAQAMAISIDSIVRSIEDEKISEEERDKARDVWSRIDGINEKVLMLPQSDRLLMSEESIWKPVPGKEKRTLSDAAEGGRTTPLGSSGPGGAGKKEKSTTDRLRILKGQKSFRRLSDMVGSESREPSMGSKRDVWLVVFSDVILRCQRVGVTRLATSYPSSSRDSRHKGKRMLPGQERNLYKFLKIERWEKHPSVVLKEANRAHEDDMAAGGGGGGGARNGVGGMNGHQAGDEKGVKIAIPASQNGVDHGQYGKLEGNEEYERIRRESAMSFSYELDDPKPISSNVLQSIPNNVTSRPTISKTTPPKGAGAPATRLLSPTTQSVIGKKTQAVNKFSNRVPAGGPAGASGSQSPCGSALHHRVSAGPPAGAGAGAGATAPVGAQFRYETPTTSTLAKKAHSGTGAPPLARALSPVASSKPPVTRRRAGSTSGPSGTGRRRADSGGSSAGSPAVTSKAQSNKHRPSNGSMATAGAGHGGSGKARGAVSKQPSEDFSAFKSYFDHHGHGSGVGSVTVGAAAAGGGGGGGAAGGTSLRASAGRAVAFPSS